MKLAPRFPRTGLLAMMLATLSFAASAQVGTGSPPQGPTATDRNTVGGQATTTSTGGRRMYDTTQGSFSLIPYATNGYIGLNAGRPDWNSPCGLGGFECSDSDVAYNIYTGGMFNPYFGAEVGYVNFGRSERAGGRTRAHGFNLSLVGQIPLGAVTLYGKAGGLYGRTDVTANPLSGMPSGEVSGWEKSYGAGASFNFSPRSAVVLEWNRYDIRFVGTGRHDITTTSLGYLHRF